MMHLKKFNAVHSSSKTSSFPSYSTNPKTVDNLSLYLLSKIETRFPSIVLNYTVAPKIICKEDIISTIVWSITTLPNVVPKESVMVLGTTQSLRNISSVEKVTVKSLNENSDILILPEVKGNGTVASVSRNYN